MFSQRRHNTIQLRGKPIRRPGFTLLEVLLALALSVVLLVALNTALDLYRKFTTAGRADIEQAQLVRALMQKMSADIRCVVAPPKSGAGASPSSSSTSSTSPSSSSTAGDSSPSTTDDASATPTTIQVVDPTAAYGKEVVGVLGDSQTLVLTISRPTRSYASTTDVAVAPTLSDMKSVSYFLAEQGADGLRGMVAAPPSADSAGTTTDGLHRGLARLEGDRLAISKADQASDLETLALKTKFLSSEVNFLQFRYSDGLSWYDSWGGTSAGLPRAVEITIGFPPTGDGTPQPSSTASTTLSTDLYRLVVAIPSSQPLTTTDGL